MVGPPQDDGGVGAAARGRTGELLLLAQGRAEQWGFPGILTDPGRLQVGPEPAVEVVADGDLPLLASLFPEPEDPLGPLVLQVLSPQTRHRSDPGPGIGEGAEQGPIAEAHDVGGVDRVEQIPGLLDGEPGSLAVGGVVLAAADRLKGFQGGGVAGHQGIEEVPEGGQGLVLGRAVAGEFVDEPAGQAGRNLGNLEVLLLTPGEEAPHDAGVGAAGVGIGDAGGEELIGGKQGSGAGALEDSRDRSVQIEGLGSGQKGGNNETKSIFWSAARATSSG